MARGVPGPGMRRRPTPRQGFFATALGLLLTLALGGVLPLVLAQPARAATIPINLFASALGWSDHSGGETSPGPTLNFYQGDQVRITLTSDDVPIPLSHGFFIDYNSNGLPDGDDYVSGDTTTSITFTVPADRAGSFFYRDTVVPVNYGSWSTSPNAAPTATFRAPASGTSWTGGKPHDISFDVTDPDGDLMTYTLSYSYGGVSSQTLRASSPATANPNVVSWTPTGFSATDTVLHLDVHDSRGASYQLNSPAFEVDSAAPTVASTTPASGATQVDPTTLIQVDWSEAMNKETTGAPTAFGVRRQGGSWLAGTVSWSSDAKRMTFDPSSSLNVGVPYEVHVNSTATDHSDPGNEYAGPTVWTFSTGSAVDTTPPSILALGVSPLAPIVNRSVNLTADVEDLGGLSTVKAHVTAPGYDQNLTMAHASGNRWYVNRVYAATGHYNVTIWATDTSGNVASQAGGMDISPEGTSTLPAPDSVTASLADGLVDVAWTPLPASSDLAGYHIYRRESSALQFVRLTATPFAATGPTVYRDVSAQPGHTYWYTVTSVDQTGAESTRAQAVSVTIPPYQNPPLFDPVPWAVAGVTLGVILGALYGMVWRRRPA